jgi:hypothetical protein
MLAEQDAHQYWGFLEFVVYMTKKGPEGPFCEVHFKNCYHAGNVYIALIDFHQTPINTVVCAVHYIHIFLHSPWDDLVMQRNM